MSANFVAKPKHAYGVDPRREEYYSLREARYDALADDIDAWAAEAARQGRKLRVIDVGCTSGVLFRHLEPRPHSDNIEIEATDVKKEHLYRSERYTSYRIDDLMAGNPGTPSNAFDVVVCEQVLEHLPRVDVAIAALERIAKPGGKVCVGVPIFLSPLAFVRNRWIWGIADSAAAQEVDAYPDLLAAFLSPSAPAPLPSQTHRDARIPHHLRRSAAPA